jgi:hypothetical protein
MNYLKKHLETAKQVILTPKVFFSGLNPSQGYQKPLLFFLVNIILMMVLSFIFTSLITFRARPFPGFLLSLIIGTPSLLVMLFICSIVLHAIAKLLKGQAVFASTLQVVSYTSAIGPLSSIPFLGLFISLYQLYLLILGLSQIHKFSKLRALITVLIPSSVMFLVGLLAAIIFGIAMIRTINRSDMKLPTMNSNQYQKTIPGFIPGNNDQEAL